MKAEKIRTARLIKLSDDAFGGKHPNGVNEGHCASGITEGPVVGERCYVGSFSTSIVTKIINEDTFKSTYSTYRIIYTEEPKVTEPSKTEKKLK